MQESDLALAAHLMRRAGFGATRDELEVLSARSYEAVVEDLIHPERFPTSTRTSPSATSASGSGVRTSGYTGW